MNEVEQKKCKTFREYYLELSADGKQKFETTIARKCMKTPGTVRAWGYGYRRPSALCKSLVAAYLKVSVEELFPVQVNEEAC